MKRLDEEARERLMRAARLRARRELSRKVRREAKRLNRETAIAGRRAFAERHDVLFDRNLRRAQIVLPEVLSFAENYEDTVDVIESLRELGLRARHPVMIHFTGVKRIDPSAALVLVAEIFRIRNLRSSSAVTGTYPRHRHIYDLLAEMGFFELLNIEEPYGPPKNADDPSRTLFLRFASGNRVEAQGVDRFVAMIEKNVMPMNEVARGKLVAAIVEAMTNTLDHAHPVRVAGETMPNRWWMSSSLNLVAREITIMLFDQGVGVPNTLDPTLYERIRALLTRLSAEPSDGEKIMAATELHRTSTEQSGRGKGFRNMKQFVDVCSDGELTVLSNRGRYTYIAGTDTYANESLSIGGTVIEWRFRHDGSVDMEDE